MYKLFFVLLFLLTNVALAQNSPTTHDKVTVIPALVGGINGKGVLTCNVQVTGLCSTVKSYDEYFTCSGEKIQTQPGCEQTAAFFKATNNLIDQIKPLKSVALIYAENRDSGQKHKFFMVSQQGELVSLTGNVNLPDAIGYKELQQNFSKPIVLPISMSHHFPPAILLPDGTERVTFLQKISNGCAGCTTVAVVEIAYDFDKTGKFLGAHALEINLKK